MEKYQIENELKKYTDGAMIINQSELKKALHRGHKWIVQFTDGLPSWRDGRTVNYPVKAVASRLHELMNAGENYFKKM